jgi:pantoate--beta-alanine ligase
VDIAKTKSDTIIASLFVNPAQFAAGEDLDTYPRTEEADLRMLERMGTDAVYIPPVDDIYPDIDRSHDMALGAPAKGLESDYRPHFFDGVMNVVARLFDHVKPNSAVFGEKDYQQLMVIHDMTQRYAMPIEVIGAPTIRDEYGLALSSRNAYLSDEELVIARQLNVILRGDNPTPADLIRAGFDKVDYIETRWNRILAAAWVGKTRLIDNVPHLQS